MNHSQESPQDQQPRIDVRAVLSQRLGRGMRWVPAWAVEWLRRLVCEDRLNEMLRVNSGRQGVDFSRGVLRHLGVTYDVSGTFPADRRVVVVSNHPLGGLDGMALSCVVADAYGKEGLKFVVNDLLWAIAPMRPIFLPVNKLGGQTRQGARALDEAFQGPDPVIMFPAGLVSRRRGGRVRDLQWHKMVVQKAIASGRDVVPVRFGGENSSLFYRVARWRERLGVRLNVEMALLPREVFRASGSHFHLTVGAPVACASLQGGSKAHEQAQQLRQRVYSLDEKDHTKPSERDITEKTHKAT